MSEKVRVGVVGTSGWADFLPIASLSSHNQADIVAICGRDQTRAKEVADKYHIPHIFADYKTMMKHEGLQAVAIISPDDLHHPMVMAALDAGLHVLCDKPLAMNREQAQEMYERAEAIGVKHMVLFTYRWLPHYRYLRQLILDGYIGRLYHADFRFIGGYGRSADYAWRFDQQRANGILGDLGSHMIDLAHWLFGDIATVQASLITGVEREGVNHTLLVPANDSALLAVTFANGGHASIQATAIAHTENNDMQQQVHLYGDKGTILLNVQFQHGSRDSLIRGGQSNSDQFQNIPIPSEYWAGVDGSILGYPQAQSIFCSQSVGPRLFIDAILENQDVSPNFYDGFQAQKIVDAAIESSLNNQTVLVG